MLIFVFFQFVSKHVCFPVINQFIFSLLFLKNEEDLNLQDFFMLIYIVIFIMCLEKRYCDLSGHVNNFGMCLQIPGLAMRPWALKALDILWNSSANMLNEILKRKIKMSTIYCVLHSTTFVPLLSKSINFPTIKLELIFMYLYEDKVLHITIIKLLCKCNIKCKLIPLVTYTSQYK